MNIDPMELLNQQFNSQMEALNTSLGQQEQQLDNIWRAHYGNLENQYNIERKYLEQTPGELEQKKKALLSLNKKYEMKVNDLRTKMQPHVQQIEMQRTAAQTKLNNQMAQSKMELQTIDKLMTNGLIADSQAALRYKLKVIGMEDVAASITGPPKTGTMLRDINAELATIQDALEVFEPPGIEGTWYGIKKRTPLRYETRNPVTGETKLVKPGELEQETFQELNRRREELTMQRNLILSQGRLAMAMERAGRLQRNPMKSGAHDLVAKPQTKGKLTDPVIAQQILDQASGDVIKARQLARQLGYDLNA